MTAIIRWLQPGEIVNDISERVDNGSEPRFIVTTNAEECSIGSSVIMVRDPDGDYHLVGLNRFDIQEDDSISDDPFIWIGRMSQRKEHRGRYLTGASRDIEVQLEDLNTQAANYIVGDTEDADRPSEDHGDRIAWLLGTAACASLLDTSLVIVTTSVTMPAYDYTGMSPQQVIDDCARASGYDNFIWFNGATNESGLVYALASGDWLTTEVRLTNVPSEVGGTTFYIGDETSLTHDPTRVASRVFGRGDGVDGFATNAATEVLFARRDVAMDFPTVRSQATLEDRMDRALTTDIDTEETIVSGMVELPSAYASMFKAGHRFELHATHLTGYQDDFAWARVLNATHTLLTPKRYRIDFEAQGPMPAPPEPSECAANATPSDTYLPLGSATTDADAVVYYGRAGSPAPETPTPGFVGNPNFPAYSGGGGPDYMGDCAASYVRVMVVGSGTLDVASATYSATPRNVTATLYHRDGTELVADDVQAGVTGDSFEFDVDTHDGVFCIHFVDLVDTGEVCGGKFGFAGASWVSTE